MKKFVCMETKIKSFGESHGKSEECHFKREVYMQGDIVVNP